MDRKFLEKLVGSYLALVAILWGLLLYSFKHGILIFSSPHDQELLPLVIILFVSAFVPLLLFLMIGIGRYVYVDAKTRGMNGVLWTLVVIFVPYFIGLIVYLIVRNPLPVECPACQRNLPSGAAFCPQCGQLLKRQCPACRGVLDGNDRFCHHCGTPIAARS